MNHFIIIVIEWFYSVAKYAHAPPLSEPLTQTGTRVPLPPSDDRGTRAAACSGAFPDRTTDTGSSPEGCEAPSQAGRIHIPDQRTGGIHAGHAARWIM